MISFHSRPGYIGAFPTYSMYNTTSYRPTNEGCLMRMVATPGRVRSSVLWCSGLDKLTSALMCLFKVFVRLVSKVYGLSSSPRSASSMTSKRASRQVSRVSLALVSDPCELIPPPFSRARHLPPHPSPSRPPPHPSLSPDIRRDLVHQMVPPQCSCPTTRRRRERGAQSRGRAGYFCGRGESQDG